MHSIRVVKPSNDDSVGWMSSDDDERRSNNDNDEKRLSDSEVNVYGMNSSDDCFNGDFDIFDSSGNMVVDSGNVGDIVLNDVVDGSDGGDNSDDDLKGGKR